MDACCKTTIARTETVQGNFELAETEHIGHLIIGMIKD